MENLNHFAFGDETIDLIRTLKSLLSSPSVTSFMVSLGVALKSRVNLINISCTWREKIPKKYFRNLVDMFEKILSDIKNMGCITVVAAGNERDDLDHIVAVSTSTEGSENEEVEIDLFATIACKPDFHYSFLLVAALDQAGKLASFSSYGNSTVFIAAPGEAIPVLNPSRLQCTEVSGTSFAAPQVTAALAMLRRMFPAASPVQTVQRLMEKVDLSNDLLIKCRSNGRMNLARSLKLDLYGPFGLFTHLPAEAAALEDVWNRIAAIEQSCRNEIALSIECSVALNTWPINGTAIANVVANMERVTTDLQNVELENISNEAQKSIVKKWRDNTLWALKIEVVKLQSVSQSTVERFI